MNNFPKTFELPSFNREVFGVDVGDDVTFPNANPNVIYTIKRLYLSRINNEPMAHCARRAIGCEPDYGGAPCVSLKCENLTIIPRR
jgi:hypothetical protein